MDITIVGKSVRGASHIRSGTECQDSSSRLSLPDGTRILAVADGHGSQASPYSKDGSKLAARVFCQIMRTLYLNYSQDRNQLISYLNREGSTQIAKCIDETWKNEIYKIHVSKGRNSDIKVSSELYRQYGTTLLGLVVAKDFQFALQIGDGDICYVDGDGFCRILEGDKFLGVETHSLSRTDAWQKVVSALQRRSLAQTVPSVYILSSDGFCNSFRDDTEFKRACIEYYRTLCDYGHNAVEESLNNWLRETSEFGCGDDITVLMAYCH